MVSFMICTASVRNILDTPSYRWRVLWGWDVEGGMSSGRFCCKRCWISPFYCQRVQQCSTHYCN
jgi:hypothetical protein